MNLLIGFVILLCLICSEIQTAEVATDLWTRLFMMGMVSMTVPGLALFQTLVVSHRFQNSELTDDERESMLRRLSVCHSAVWLCASLAIIWAIRWQDIVRANWNLDRWPLADEALIIAPVILSLVASWAIFFETQRSIEPNRKRFDLGDLRRRIAYVSIRFRVYLLMVLIPISIAILARDLAPWIESLATTVQAVWGLSCLLLISAGFPFVLLLVWKTERIPDADLRASLRNLCKQHRLLVHDVRVWNTGGAIINAVAAGILPGFRVILLSDCLIKQFTRSELLAVVRHEAGHIKLCHLPTRIGFIALPLLAMAIDERCPFGLQSSLETSLMAAGAPAGSTVGLFCAIYLLYLLVTLPWLSHQVEFEADIYSCQQTSRNDQPRCFNPVFASDMSDALFRLAAASPSSFERARLLHPSIHSRIKMIQAFIQSPEKAEEFCRSFARRRRYMLATLILLCLTAAIPGFAA